MYPDVERRKNPSHFPPKSSGFRHGLRFSRMEKIENMIFPLRIGKGHPALLGQRDKREADPRLVHSDSQSGKAAIFCQKAVLKRLEKMLHFVVQVFCLFVFRKEYNYSESMGLAISVFSFSSQKHLCLRQSSSLSMPNGLPQRVLSGRFYLLHPTVPLAKHILSWALSVPCSLSMKQIGFKFYIRQSVDKLSLVSKTLTRNRETRQIVSLS